MRKCFLSIKSLILIDNLNSFLIWFFFQKLVMSKYHTTQKTSMMHLQLILQPLIIIVVFLLLLINMNQPPLITQTKTPIPTAEMPSPSLRPNYTFTWPTIPSSYHIDNTVPIRKSTSISKPPSYLQIITAPYYYPLLI